MLATTAVAVFSLAMAATAATVASAAEFYPQRPVRVVLPAGAGSGPDVLARALAAQLERQTGKPFVIDNRAGANGIIGAEIVARSAADGYTVMHASPGFLLNTLVYSKPSYDVQRDFVAITNVASGSGYLLLVNPVLAVRSVAELMVLAKSRPLNYASPPAGNTLHLASEMFNLRAGVRLQHVPYKGGSDAFTALMNNDVQVVIAPPAGALPYVQSGRLRALAFTGSRRLSLMPEVPTVAESGLPDYIVDFTWNGWFAPAATPPAVVVRLQREIQQAVAAPPLRDLLQRAGFAAVADTPAAFDIFVKAELQRYAAVVREARIRAE